MASVFSFCESDSTMRTNGNEEQKLLLIGGQYDLVIVISTFGTCVTGSNALHFNYVWSDVHATDTCRMYCIIHN